MKALPPGTQRITPGRWTTCSELVLYYTDGTTVRTQRSIMPDETFDIPDDSLGDPAFFHAWWAPRGAWLRSAEGGQ